MRQIIFTVAALLFLNCNKAKRDMPDFIKFEHVGITRYYYPPLYLSTKKVNIHLNDRQLADMRLIFSKSGSDSIQEKEKYIKLMFKRIITDRKTISTINEFIFNHQEFYTTNGHQNVGTYESYSINSGGKMRFTLFYKLQGEFFEKLTTELKNENCDKRVIEVLSAM